MLNFITSQLKTKLGPFWLGGATVLVLLAALVLSGSISHKVLAGDANTSAGTAISNSTKPATTTPTTPTTPTTTPAAKPVPPPTNLNVPTGENIDQTGNSGFVFCGNTVDTPCNITHLFRTMIVIINYLISMVGLVAILFIVINGVRMIISQGTLPAKETDQSQLTKAKKGVTSAVTGLLLVAVAFVLINSLLAGSLNIGIRDGALILSNPKAYINAGSSRANTNSSSSSGVTPNTFTDATADNLDPIQGTSPGTGEGAGLETTADLLTAPTASFCNIRGALNTSNFFADLFLPKVAYAQQKNKRKACTEVKTGAEGGPLFPYILRQQDYAKYTYGGCPSATSISESGCGPTALAMALYAAHELGHQLNLSPEVIAWGNKNGTSPYSPILVAKLSSKTGGRGVLDGVCDGSNGDFAEKVMPYYGGSSYKATSESAIDNALNNGQYVLARMKPSSSFSGGGHFILVWAIDKDYNGTGEKWYKIADPNVYVDVRIASSSVFYRDLNDAQILSGI